MAADNRGRIVNRGMGGFLNPPGHPEHHYSVETDLRRRPQNRGSMSLSYAVTCDWLEPGVKAQAQKLLEEWKENHPAVTHPDMVDWTHQVLGYYRHCYRNPAATAGGEWDAHSIIVDESRDVLADADSHAGVHFIRQFFPHYVPMRADIDAAYWGTKQPA